MAHELCSGSVCIGSVNIFELPRHLIEDAPAMLDDVQYASRNRLLRRPTDRNQPYRVEVECVIFLQRLTL